MEGGPDFAQIRATVAEHMFDKCCGEMSVRLQECAK